MPPATYYNEHDSQAAEWLRNLIAAGELSPGDVDTRSIVDVQPGDLDGYHRVHFFAGIGGWDLALQLAGWPAQCQVWTGSPPCQPFSYAGKQRGEADARHLWPEMYRLVSARRPATCFGEQVESHLGREWLSGVRHAMGELGYAVGAACLPASCVAAPHIRQRIYWVGGLGYSDRSGLEREPGVFDHPASRQRGGLLTDQQPLRAGELLDPWGVSEEAAGPGGDVVRVEPGSSPVAYGIPDSLGDGQPQLRGLLGRAKTARKAQFIGYGNAIVPQVGARFITAYMEVLDGR